MIHSTKTEREEMYELVLESKTGFYCTFKDGEHFPCIVTDYEQLKRATGMAEGKDFRAGSQAWGGRNRRGGKSGGGHAMQSLSLGPQSLA